MGGLISVALGVLGAVQSMSSGYAQAQAASTQATQAIRDASIKADVANINAGLQAAQQKQETQALRSKQLLQGVAAGVDINDQNSSLITLMTTSQDEAKSERDIMLAKGRLEAATTMANGFGTAAAYSKQASSAKKYGLLGGAFSLGTGLYRAGAFDGFSNVFKSGSSDYFFNKPLAESQLKPYTWNY